MDIGKFAHKAKWFLYATAAYPAYFWTINMEPRFSKEVRDLKALVKGYQDEYAGYCKQQGKKNTQRLRVRHEVYDQVMELGLMHDFIIEDRDFWLGTIRIVIDASRKTGSTKLTYTKSYMVQNMGEQFKECKSVADAITKLDTFKVS